MINNSEFEYDVVLSFAGEDRRYAKELFEILTAKYQRKVFYDSDKQADLLGEELNKYLQPIYSDKARYAVVFISKNYIEKEWTKYEFEQIKKRNSAENGKYVIPLKLDDTSVVGISYTTSYLDLRSKTIAQAAELIEQKLKNLIKKEPDLSTPVDRDTNSDKVLSNPEVLPQHKSADQRAEEPEPYNILRNLLNQRFTGTEEIIQLTYYYCQENENDLRLYEEIESLTDKQKIIRKIIVYLTSRNHLKIFIEYIKKERPDIK